MPQKPPQMRLNQGSRSWSKTNFNYQSGRWKKLSRMVKNEEPLCRECLKNGRPEASKVADHIIPISEGGSEWDRDNLQGLCESCHNRKSAIESNTRRGA